MQANVNPPSSFLSCNVMSCVCMAYVSVLLTNAFHIVVFVLFVILVRLNSFPGVHSIHYALFLFVLLLRHVL